MPVLIVRLNVKKVAVVDIENSFKVERCTCYNETTVTNAVAQKLYLAFDIFS